MLTKIDGSCYIDLLNNGIKSLEKYRTVLNDLNVFPVPDGDTGTNMVMTLRYGYEAVKGKKGSLGEISQQFASAAVFGARGNSGVIVSQFFKGVAESFRGLEEADCYQLSAALKNGCCFAYASVARPVEGTILTVLKDASAAVERALPLKSIEEVIATFWNEARVSLKNTPELLPILKKANVVDSGGSGIVYFFEGVKKYLDGETVEATEEAHVSEYIDLSRFNKDTSFDYGYCVEGLIQLKLETEKFDLKTFKRELSVIGNSVVASLESDKIKLHVHTKTLGKLMDYCQKFGEFLTIKIENMTVQNMQKAQETEKEQEVKKFLYSTDREPTEFAVVAVASNPIMQQRFFEMGADVVILSEIAPSSQDFIDAFELTNAKRVLVFPNSSNSILTSMQAGSMYKRSKVRVLNCRSLAECYAVLSVMDFDVSIDEATALANDTISNIYQFSIYHATKDIKYGSRRISQNQFFALSGKDILNVENTLGEIAYNTIKSTLEERECSVITLFYGNNIASEYVALLTEKIAELDEDVEVAAVSTHETIYDFTVTFE